MKPKRPYVFIGSSVEGHHVAAAVQQNLQFCSEPEVWSQGGFGLTDGTLESLVKKLDAIDFAVLVLTADDLVQSRGELKPAPRDNVLFELGLFIGGLGRERTFMICDRSVKIKLPSDLAGITPATYEPPESSGWQAAVGPASTAIADTIKRVGRRQDRGIRVQIVGGFFMDIGGQGLHLNVTNAGTKAIPPYKIALFHPKLGTYFMFPSEQSGELLPDQKREHKATLLGGAMAHQWLPHFQVDREGNRLNDEEFVFRLVLENSDKVLYENKRIGVGFARAMLKILTSKSLDLTFDETMELNSDAPPKTE
jgi:Predicted nucleotide-binding protein containing TIR-like domain